MQGKLARNLQQFGNQLILGFATKVTPTTSSRSKDWVVVQWVVHHRVTWKCNVPKLPLTRAEESAVSR